MCQEIEELKQTCRDAHLKVILETGALKTASNIKKASLLSIYSGADFIKTSTGGISTTADAVKYYCVVKEVLGEKWLTNEYFRIGASRLANNLLSDIWGNPTKFF